MKLDGTVALVTGGARRVGRAIVLELGRAGCDVAIHCHRSKSEAAQLAEEVRGFGRRAAIVCTDLEDPASWSATIAQTVKAFGRLDVLINNAAVFLTERADTLAEFDHGQWESVLRTNLMAPAGLCHHALPYLSAGGCGKIINLCDAASDRPWPRHLTYCVSKAALAALTRGLARALAPTIQVNGVAPGIAIFPESYSAAQRRTLTQKVPLRREGSPEEVARLVRFLIEEGDYVTGQILDIDGGRSLV